MEVLHTCVLSHNYVSVPYENMSSSKDETGLLEHLQWGFWNLHLEHEHTILLTYWNLAYIFRSE